MKKTFFVFVFSIFTTVVFAQNEKKSITLDEALKLALENNVSIKREQISLGAAERASKHSWNNLLPSIAVSANDEVEFPYSNNFGVEGKVAVSFTSDFLASIKKAKLDYEAKKIVFFIVHNILLSLLFGQIFCSQVIGSSKVIFKHFFYHCAWFFVKCFCYMVYDVAYIFL